MNPSQRDALRRCEVSTREWVGAPINVRPKAQRRWWRRMWGFR